jgi:hypothetical protein
MKYDRGKAVKVALRPLDGAELGCRAHRLRTLVYPDHPAAHEVGWHASVSQSYTTGDGEASFWSGSWVGGLSAVGERWLDWQQCEKR